MSSMGSGTKSDCAGAGQQQFTPTRSESTTPKVVRQINTAKNPKGPWTKIYCAGEGQHQFNRNRIHANRQSHDAFRDVREKNMVMVPAWCGSCQQQFTRNRNQENRKQIVVFDSSGTSANFCYTIWRFIPETVILIVLLVRFVGCLHSCSWHEFLQVVKLPIAAALIPGNPMNYPSSRTMP
jgi:hypothetical protein